MREMHLLNKATVVLATLVLTPFLIWITNRKDKKLQDMEDEIILRGKDGKSPLDETPESPEDAPK